MACSLALPAPALAARGDCAQPLTNGPNPLASDCLYILQTAVFLRTCVPSCICAPKGSLPTSATDALLCLRAATGLPGVLNCPCQIVTTTMVTHTSMSTSTSTPVTFPPSTLDFTSTTSPLFERVLAADGSIAPQMCCNDLAVPGCVPDR